MRVGSHLRIAVGLEGIVGGGVERILKMNALARILGKVGIGEQRSPLAVRIFLLQTLNVLLCRGRVALPAVEEEQVIVGVGHLVEVGILAEEPLELLLAECQIVELILEDYAAVEEPVLDDIVAFGHLLLGEGNLLEIVFPLVRVVLGRVGNVRQ